jgi:subtilisin family serine protease
VDRKGRVLIEAGRATHLDYAAPAADMLAGDSSGRPVRVRGTSYAAPLVAALIGQVYAAPHPGAREQVLAALDRSARRAGPRYGRGILCESCVTRP